MLYGKGLLSRHFEMTSNSDMASLGGADSSKLMLAHLQSNRSAGGGHGALHAVKCIPP